jgi:DNA-binding SARP family transcriptional activator/pimeloyl-ACP methyl ester carboxylesterase
VIVVRVSILGPLQVDDVPGSVVIGAAKERSLLSALALRPGSIVSTDALIGALWGDDPPAAARKTLQTYVWNLRQALGADTISTEPTGYVLRVDADDVDVSRFRALVRAGTAAMRDRSASEARANLADAVTLWRGEPFAGVASHTGLATEGIRLHEEYLSALEARIAADLADGRHTELVGELEALVREHRFRERLWGYLMVALYRCGRQADALAAYQRVRTILCEDLGLEPGGELRRLEAAILDHDPSLAAPTSTSTGERGAIVRSPVRYARTNDNVSVAYQVAGHGPTDVLAVAGFVSHLDLWWNAPTDRLVRRLTSMGRLISFDKRGMGLSDRPEVVAPQRWVDDAIAVLDAAECERAVVLGVSAGGLTAIRLAVQHPERVRALILHGAFARALSDLDYPIGWDRDIVKAFAEELEREWGTGVWIDLYAPSRAEDPGVRDYWARYQQLSASPTSALRFFWAAIEDDVRDLLPAISVPTIVIHAERDPIVPLAQAQYIADRIPGAAMVALDSDVHLICTSDVIDELADAAQGFIDTLPSDVPGRELEHVPVRQ